MKDTQPGTMSIGVSMNREATDADSVSITIEDDASRLMVLRLEMSFLDLCNAFRGLGNVPCAMWLNRSADIGKRHEVKHEQVPIPDVVANRTHRHREDDSYDTDLTRVRTYLAGKGWCVDGWEPDTDAVFNHHNIVRTKDKERTGWHTYRIAFHRYVAP
jgi:hypothetical protein